MLEANSKPLPVLPYPNSFGWTNMPIKHNWVYNDYYHEWINLNHIFCLRVVEMKEDFCVVADLSCINENGTSEKILFTAKTNLECHEWVKKMMNG